MEKKLTEWFGRGFHPQTTMDQIMEYGKDKINEWKVDPRIGCITDGDDEYEDRPKGMYMKLNHRNYQDTLFITLDWDDTYHIRFLNEEQEVTHEIEFVYCDQLFEVIDRYINFGILSKVSKEQLN
jgi:hypothetical protein